MLFCSVFDQMTLTNDSVEFRNHLGQFRDYSIPSGTEWLFTHQDSKLTTFCAVSDDEGFEFRIGKAAYYA